MGFMGALGAMDPDIHKFEDLDVWHPLFFGNLLVPWHLGYPISQIPNVLSDHWPSIKLYFKPSQRTFLYSYFFDVHVTKNTKALNSLNVNLEFT